MLKETLKQQTYGLADSIEKWKLEDMIEGVELTILRIKHKYHYKHLQ